MISFAHKGVSLPRSAKEIWRAEWNLLSVGWGCIATLLALFAFYLAMFLRYRPYDVDNPWFLSFSYDAGVDHIVSDRFMNVAFPAGMDGTQFFGKLAAFLQYVTLQHCGWQQWPAAILAATIVTASLGTWWRQLHKLGYSSPFILLFLIAVGLSEPFLSMATKFRYEYCSFALISLGLLLISYRKLFWGIFFAALAIEVQPIALAGLIPVTILACTMHKLTRDVITRLVSGLTLAFVVYVVLHPNIAHIGDHLTHSKIEAASKIGGFFSAYFLQRSRHLPELLAFIVGAVFYWRRRKMVGSHYFAISALILTVFSIVMPHGNVSYMVFLYPFLVAMTLIALNAASRPRLSLLLMVLYFAPQYSTLVYMTRDQGYRAQDIRQVSEAIADASHQRHISDSNLKIYGDYSLWFSHPHFYQAAAKSTASSAHSADLYLCYNYPIQSRKFAPEDMIYCPELRRMLRLKLLSTISVRNNTLYLYAKE